MIPNTIYVLNIFPALLLFPNQRSILALQIIYKYLDMLMFIKNGNKLHRLKKDFYNSFGPHFMYIHLF